MIHILGMNKCDYKIDQDKNSSFEWYTELGWEVVIGRLQAIRMIQDGRITSADTIVALKDRMFMYTRIHANVREWVPGIEPCGGLRPDAFGEYALELFDSKHLRGNHTDTIYKFQQDIPMILNHDYEEVNPPKCIIINHRKRGWCTERNMKEDITRKLIGIGLELGLKVYLSGMNAEGLDNRAEYVPTLRKTASIMHHPNCKAFIGSGGPALLAQQCCPSKLIFINTCGSIGCNPLFLQNRMNFAKHKMFIVPPDNLSGVKQIIDGRNVIMKNVYNAFR